VPLGTREEIEEVLEAVGIDPRRRAETLDLTEFRQMAEALKGNPTFASGRGSS
jgi:16S rRNA A1518/A1519 N6-dimethyltransferase RsmA/KsgA/DIM1 with predicted DNA glycosylase/AP lyase activity